VDWSRLDIAAYRVSVKRAVRAFARSALVVGAIALGCGIGVRSVPLVAIGLAVMAACTWNLARTSVAGLVVQGCTLILSGAFTCFAGWWYGGMSSTNAGKAVIPGLMQIVMGIRHLVHYRTARRVVNDPEAIARPETIVRELSKRDAKTDENVVEFGTHVVHPHRSRVGLYAEGAVALLEHQVVRLERRTDIWIEPRGTTALGRSIKVEVRLGDVQLSASMPEAHFQRFERWKTGASPSQSLAA